RSRLALSAKTPTGQAATSAVRQEIWPPRRFDRLPAVPDPLHYPVDIVRDCVVLEVLAGLKSPSEIARQHKPKRELISRWMDTALEGLTYSHEACCTVVEVAGR